MNNAVLWSTPSAWKSRLAETKALACRQRQLHNLKMLR